MKKYLLLTNLLLISMTLFACGLSSDSLYIGDDKKEIVEDKYGEVEYISQDIYVYKNLKDEFNHIDGLDYIINNSGYRGSVAPEFSENFYVIIDIVRHDNSYKVLVYNNMMKKSADQTQMFILTDYFLPIRIEDVITLINNHDLIQDVKNFEICFIKKDSNLDSNLSNHDELNLAFYNKQPEGKILMSFYDDQTGHALMGTQNYIVFGNVKEKEIYFPTDLDYNDLTFFHYDTLKDVQVEFSLDKGQSFKMIDERLEEFDIWDKTINTEVPNVVFFYAFTYEAFLIKVDEARNPSIFSYNYLNEEEFDNLVEMYDEAYFEDNILVFYYKFESNVSENYVYSVTKKNDTLTININRFEGMATALSAWLEIITIKKSDVEDINKVNLIVRTVSSLQSSVVAYINKAYIRDFYLNGKTLEDFKDLDNLKEIKLFTWSLNVDLIFNKEMSDDDLNEMIAYLENNPYLKSIGYKGKDFIRVQLNNNFYDEIVDKTLVIHDFIKDEALINDYALTIKILNFTPIASIEFVLDDKGKDYAIKMIEDLKMGDYPFLKIGWGFCIIKKIF